MNWPMLLRIAAALLPLFATGCAHAPVSRLSAEEREMVLAMGQGIDASTPPDGIRSEVGAVLDLIVPGPSGGIPCRLYRPANPADAANPTSPDGPAETAARGTVLLVHGGAWVAGSVDFHDNMARLICSTSQANVLSVEYSRTPDALYPTQLREIRAVLRWLNRKGQGAGLAPRPLALCGDSAGGNLCAVLARESAAGSIALAVLINPVVDLTLAHVSDPEVRGFSELMLKAYVPAGIDFAEPDLSPLLSPVPKSHPPTFLAIGDSDPWRAEQDLYAEKLAAAGVPLQVFRAPTGHLGPDGAAATPLALPTLTNAAEAIRTAFAR